MFEQVWVYCIEGSRHPPAVHILLGINFSFWMTRAKTLCTYYKKPCIGDMHESHRDIRLNWLQGYSIYLKNKK